MAVQPHFKGIGEEEKLLKKNCLINILVTKIVAITVIF